MPQRSPDDFSWLTIDQKSSVPSSVQLHDQIARAVRNGDLVPGTRLPSVRNLATMVAIATNTAAKAVKSLEEAGIVSTHGRHGTIVRDADAAASNLREGVSTLARHAIDLGLGPETVHAMLDAAFAHEQTRRQDS